MNSSKEIKIILVVIFIAVILTVGGILLLKAMQPASPAGGPAPTAQISPPQPPDTEDFILSEVEGWQTYRNEEAGLEFRYPGVVLSLEENKGKVTLKHSVPYEHPDVCDFRGTGTSLQAIVDFRATVEIIPSSFQETLRSEETEYFTEQYLRQGKLITVPEFIEEASFGSLNGHRITKSVEGCGAYYYYFPLPSGRETLKVQRDFVPELLPTIREYETYKAVPGIILPEQEERLFEQILATFLFGASEGIKVPRFEDYLVKQSDIFQGTPAPVDFSTLPGSEMFFTRLTEGAKKGPNFAGQYTLVEWGCGTACQSGMLLEAKTGAVLSWLPIAEAGRNYRFGSNLLVINPPDVTASYAEEIRPPTYYFIWNGTRLQQLQDGEELDISGWQIYRNEELGFEIRYPQADMFLFSDDISVVSFYKDTRYEGIKFGELKSGCTPYVYPDIDEHFLKLLEEIKQENLYQFPAFPLSQIIVSDQGKNYLIGFSFASRAVDGRDCEPIFNQMLSTFRFIE